MGENVALNGNSKRYSRASRILQIREQGGPLSTLCNDPLLKRIVLRTHWRRSCENLNCTAQFSTSCDSSFRSFSPLSSRFQHFSPTIFPPFFPLFLFSAPRFFILLLFFFFYSLSFCWTRSKFAPVAIRLSPVFLREPARELSLVFLIVNTSGMPSNSNKFPSFNRIIYPLGYRKLFPHDSSSE